jgi:hypothetical protein
VGSLFRAGCRRLRMVVMLRSGRTRAPGVTRRRDGAQRRRLLQVAAVTAFATWSTALLSACGAEWDAQATVTAATTSRAAVPLPVGTARLPSPPPAATARPGTYVVDHALGVTLILPAGWQQNAPGKQPPHEIDLVIPPAQPAGDSTIRLVIGSWGTTTDPDAAQAASAGMDRLLAGLGTLPTPLTRSVVTYGGAPGVMVHGLPGGLGGPSTAIILAHDGALYKILAPGSALAPDQQYALESLVFIPRVGPFPPAN